MNKANLATTNSTATLEQIYDHLLKCKDNYQPPLDTYTAIPEYAQKLKQNATTFETWSETQLIGLIACYFNTQKKEGYITNVSILKEYQGRRIASHLIEETLQHSYKNGIKTIKLHANNQKAIQFYEKHGFTVESNEYNRALMSKKLESQITVSICCVTYNHGEYIKQALDSFLAQKTRFNIEILIHDDASTDNTPQIIEKIEKKYPTIIKPIYQKENQFSKGIPISRTFNFPRARGKYIALCEGDDYWTDPYKLQKQVDFLEANKDFIICLHDTIEVNEKGEFLKHRSDNFNFINEKKPQIASEIPVDWFLRTRGNFIHTSSFLFRNIISDLSFINTGKIISGDMLLLFLLLKNGRAQYLPESMSAYRHHPQGITKTPRKREKVLQSYLTLYRLLKTNYNGLYQKEFKLLIASVKNELLSYRIHHTKFKPTNPHLYTTWINAIIKRRALNYSLMDILHLFRKSFSQK